MTDFFPCLSVKVKDISLMQPLNNIYHFTVTCFQLSQVAKINTHRSPNAGRFSHQRVNLRGLPAKRRVNVCMQKYACSWIFKFSFWWSCNFFTLLFCCLHFWAVWGRVDTQTYTNACAHTNSQAGKTLCHCLLYNTGHQLPCCKQSAAS